MAINSSTFSSNGVLRADWILNTTTKTLTLTDQTDWVSLGLNTGAGDALKGVFKVVDPAGDTVYENTSYITPDTDIGASDTTLTGVSIPLDSSGALLEGTYSVTYSVEYTPNGGSATVLSIDKTFLFQDKTPTVTIDQVIDCSTSTLTSTETTGYTADMTVTRSHTVKAPFKSDGTPVTSDVTGALTELKVSPIYTGVYTTLIDNIVVIDLGGNSYTTSTAGGTSTIDVKCDDSLCDLFCCIKSYTKTMQDAKSKNQQRYYSMQETWGLIMGYYVIYDFSKRCGEEAKASEYYSKILDLAGCEAGCGCGSDGEPTLVIAVGGSGTANVVDPGTGISVSSSDVGGVTHYTVSISQAYIDKINNAATPTTVASGDTQYISITSSGSDYTVTYIGYKPDLLSFILKLDYASPAAVTITKERKKLWSGGGLLVYDGDSNTVNPKLSTIYSYSTTTEFGNIPAAYELSGWGGTGVSVPHVEVEIQEIVRTSDSDDIRVYETPDIRVEIIEVDITTSNSIKLRFVDNQTGAVLTHNHMIDNYNIDYIMLKMELRLKD